MLAVALAAACGAGERGAAGGDPWTTLAGWPRHEAEAIRVGGVVEAGDLEGGIWIIRDPEGAEWAPLDLPEGFRVEGAGVVADVRLRPDLLSIGMRGTLVEILRIRHSSVAVAPPAAAGTGGAAGGDGGVGAPADLVGEWRIDATHRPGASAGTATSEWWTGERIRYGNTFVFGPNAGCERAGFEVRRVAADALLSGRFGVPPETVPPLAETDAVRLVEVRCDGAGWDAMGAVVLLAGDGTALIAWQGAFLELARLP